MEKMGYSYAIYDYDSENKKCELKYTFNGTPNPEREKCMDCKNCKYYKKHGSFDNIYLFDLLEQRQKEQENQEEQ